MKLGIMQPYFCPYIGYFQLMNAVDQMVLYDNIEYTKKGWINRNRMLMNGQESLFTIPLKSDSDYLDIRDRRLADDALQERQKILSRIHNSYSKAPRFKMVFPLIEDIFMYAGSDKLFDFIYYSIKQLNSILDIDTRMIISSDLDTDHSLKGAERVLAINKLLASQTYINTSGGEELYDKEVFKEQQLELYFIKSKWVEYRQFDHEFVPWLSVIDVLMFNDPSNIKELLNQYELI